jgi:hypothetical protein
MCGESYAMRMCCVPDCCHSKVVIKTKDATLYMCINGESPHFGEVFTKYRYICSYAATLHEDEGAP